MPPEAEGVRFLELSGQGEEASHARARRGAAPAQERVLSRGGTRGRPPRPALLGALPLADRARYLRRCAQVILDSLDPLAKPIARATGLPRAEALSTQLLTSVDALHRTARHGPKVLADRSVGLPLLTRPKRANLVCEPLGVLGVRGSDAEPWSLPLQEVAIALMCGNGVVLESALGERIRWVFERAGVPEGVVCCGELEGLDVQRVLGPPTAHKGPVLVLADAPMRHAVAGILWGGLATGGRAASGISRVYVVREAAERLVADLVAGAEALRARRDAPRRSTPEAFTRPWRRQSRPGRCCAAAAIPAPAAC